MRERLNLTAEWEQGDGPGRMSCRKSKLKQAENDEALKTKLRLTLDHRGRKAMTIFIVPRYKY